MYTLKSPPAPSASASPAEAPTAGFSPQQVSQNVLVLPRASTNFAGDGTAK